MRSTIACQWCRKSKIKCHHKGQAPCKACSLIPGRDCVLSLPALALKPRKQAKQTIRKQNNINAHGISRVSELVSAHTDSDGTASTPTGGLSQAHLRGDGGIPRVLQHGTLLIDVDHKLIERACRILVEMYPEFSFIHTPSFFDELSKSQVDELKLLSTLALCARHIPELEERFGGPMEASEHFASLARHEVLKRAVARADIDTLQCLLMLTMHDWGTCRGFQAWMSIGIAARMGQAFSNLLDANRQTRPNQEINQPGHSDITQKEVVCRTIWASFIVDCMLGSGKHGPSAYHDKGPHVRLAVDEESFCFEAEQSTPHYLRRPLSSPEDTYEHHPPDTILGLDNYQLIIVRAIDIWANVAQWIFAGGRRIPAKDSSDPPWMEHTTWNRLYSALRCLERDVTDRLWYHLSPKNIDVFIYRGQGRQYAMINFLLAMNRLFLHREYLPFFPHRCRGPCGPIDPPLLPPNAPEHWWTQGSKEAFEGAVTIVDILRALEASGVEYCTPATCFCLYISAAALAYAIAFPHMMPQFDDLQMKLDWSLEWLENAERSWPICQGWRKLMQEVITLFDRVTHNAASLQSLCRDDFVELDKTLHSSAEVSESEPILSSISPAADLLLAMSKQHRHDGQLNPREDRRPGIARPAEDDALRLGISQVEAERPGETPQDEAGGPYAGVQEPMSFLDSLGTFDDFGRSQDLIGSMLGNQSLEDWMFLSQSPPFGFTMT